MKCGFRFLGILGLAVMIFTATGKLRAANTITKKIRSEEADKHKLDQKIRDERRKINRLRRDDKSVLGEIIRDNRKVNRARNNERLSQKNLKKVRSRLGEIREEVTDSWERVQQRQYMLGRRLSAMYRQGPLKPLTLLVGAQSSSDFLTRYRLLRQMASRDNVAINDTYKELEQISTYEKEFQVKETELEGQAREVRQAKEELLHAKRQREKRLYAIRKEKKKKEILVEELKVQSRKMQSLLERLRNDEERRKQGAPGKYPNRAGGRLGYIGWPLRGKVLNGFGAHKHPRFNTTIFNRGIEIGGHLGSPVVSAQDGAVLFAGAFEGYGQMVVMDHGSGYMTVYGHLAAMEVGVGQRLSRGQALGEVGSAGVGSVPTLYFEVRQKGKPLNPLHFLRR